MWEDEPLAPREIKMRDVITLQAEFDESIHRFEAFYVNDLVLVCSQLP